MGISIIHIDLSWLTIGVLDGSPLTVWLETGDGLAPFCPPPWEHSSQKKITFQNYILSKVKLW